MIQEPEWVKEKQVWDNLIDKLIDSYKNILSDKLEENIILQENLFTERELNTSELSNFVNKIKRNPTLSPVLYEDAFACIPCVQTPNNL